MNIEAKVKRILDPETFALQDGRTYTQQLVILDCGEYSKAGDYYENDIPVYFGERNLDKLAGVTEGAKVEVHFGLKGRVYTYTDKTDGKTQRNGYSVRLNAYDIKPIGQAVQAQPAQHPQTAQPYAPQAPMQAPTAQAPQQRAAPAYQYPQTQAPQVQQVETDDLPF